jgi:uncharacterized LabA/DUF88 family protein
MTFLPKDSVVGIFIDVENVSHQFASCITEHLKQPYEFVFKRAIGSIDHIKPWQSFLAQWQFETICTLPVVSGKNAADIRLVIEVMDLVSRRKIDSIWLISSDSDFTPLVRWLREHEISVVGFGEDKASNLYSQSFNRFIIFPLGKSSQTSSKNSLAQKKETQPQQYSQSTVLPFPQIAALPTSTQQKTQAKSGSQSSASSQAQKTSKPYAKKLRNLAQTAYFKVVTNREWITISQLEKELSAECPNHLDGQKFKLALFGYKRLIQLIEGVGIFEWNPQQKASTSKQHRQLRLTAQVYKQKSTA